MLRIGEFSKLAKTTIKALRYYDKVGLLKPAFVDSSTSYRYYTDEQLETMRLILAYKAAGMQNDDIASILRGENASDALRARREQLVRAIEETGRQIDEIDRMLGDSPPQVYAAHVRDIPACTVYYCRGYIQTVEHIRSFITACGRELKRTNPDVRYSVPDYCCVIYPESGYRETNIFIEYAQSTDRVGTDTPTLKFKTLEPIRAVSVEHRGCYDNIRDAYLYAVKWAADNGYELAGEARERYIDGAWNRDDESDWLTEIQLPVRPRGDNPE